MKEAYRAGELLLEGVFQRLRDDALIKAIPDMLAMRQLDMRDPLIKQYVRRAPGAGTLAIADLLNRKGFAVLMKAAIAKRNEELAASSTAAGKWRAEKEAGVKSK